MRRLLETVNQRFQAVTESPWPTSLDTRFERVSDHLIVAAHPTANFYVLLAHNGEVLFFDYGFPSYDHGGGGICRFVEHSVSDLIQELGTSEPSVVVVTHYHDDHVAGIPYLQREFGTQVWAFENTVDILQRPYAYRLPCLWPQPIPVDRTIREGEIFEWNGYRFRAQHNPGHTWYAAAYFGEIDGRQVGVVGDEILVSGTGRLRGGGPTYRNRIRSDSFTTGISRIMAHEPEILLTGHSGAVRVTHQELQSVYDWATELEEAWKDLAVIPHEVDLLLDPDLVTIHPYQLTSSPGSAAKLQVEVRNHRTTPQQAVIRLVVPDEWRTDPEEASVIIPASASSQELFQVIAPAAADLGVRYVLVAQVEANGRDLGQAAEALVTLSQRAVANDASNG
jgi:glyoxylase-like metal-dependent hydrolase (beta-lactamase superfamily II)